VDNAEVDLRLIGLTVIDCIDLTQDRDKWRVLVNMLMKFRVP
jgi:hypothetical protein